MKEEDILKDLIRRYPGLANCEKDIREAGQAIIACYSREGKLLLCGNGGSSADAEHIVGELMKGFEKKRLAGKDLENSLKYIAGERGAFIARHLQGALPAISLNAHSSLCSAISNDMEPRLVFAQQIAGYGNENDVLMALSTSGNSPNIIDAVITARARGLKVIGLTGESGGEMKSWCDISICVPAKETPAVQELHQPVYHAICRMVENRFF